MRTLLPSLALSLLASHADAQSSALLLGLGTERNAYRTVLVAPVDGRLVVAVDRPLLLIPRDDGWWRVDIQVKCSVTWRASAEVGRSGDDSVAFLDRVESRVAAPATQWQPAPDDGCLEAERKVMGDSTTAADEGDRCYTNDLWITHVSPRLIATRQESGTTEQCNPGRNTTEITQEVASWTGEPVSLLANLSAREADALTQRFEATRGDCALQDSPDQAWGLARTLGGWSVTFRTSGATACAGDSGGEVRDLRRAPAVLVSREASRRWVPALRKRYPDLLDVFASPTGDLVVARRRQRLVAWTPNGVELGAPALDIAMPAKPAVIMVEWARGAHVARWVRELAAMGPR